MKILAKLATLLTNGLITATICLSSAFAENSEKTDSEDVTLFRGAANNSYYEVYFNALPTPGADNVAMETHAIDLRPERDVTVHVEIFNPNGTIPLIVTPGGMGDCDGFRGFARNVAAAAPELKVFIWDRRNVGRSEVSFGTEPLTVVSRERNCSTRCTPPAYRRRRTIHLDFIQQDRFVGRPVYLICT